VGVVCYLVLSNKFPFREKSREALYQCIVTGTYTFPSAIWDSISEEAQDFVRQLLTVNPKERPTTSKALQHPWLKLADERRKRASIAIQSSSATSEEKKLGVAADQSARFALTNMQNFKRSRLQEAVKTFIASQLLMAEEKKAIDETFRDLGRSSNGIHADFSRSPVEADNTCDLSFSVILDITCNGKLSKAEVRAAYFKFFGLPLGDEELDELFRRVDLKHTGFIDYSDFVVATMNEKVLLGRNKLKKAVSVHTSSEGGSKRFCLFGMYSRR
jgi:calcium-dependent protein kinase